MNEDQEAASPATAGQFVADNDRFRMVDAVEALTSAQHPDVSAAFVDAFDIAVLRD